MGTRTEGGTGYGGTCRGGRGGREQGSFLSQIGSWGKIDTELGGEKGGGGAQQYAQGKARRGKEERWNEGIGRDHTTEGANKGGRPLPCCNLCVVMRCNAYQTRGDGNQFSIGRKRRFIEPRRLGSAWAPEDAPEDWNMTIWESITSDPKHPNTGSKLSPSVTRLISRLIIHRSLAHYCFTRGHADHLLLFLSFLYTCSNHSRPPSKH